MKAKAHRGRIRTREERAADQLYLMALMQRGHPRMTVAEATAVLNQRRAKLAREKALALGKSPEEAETAGQLAELSRPSVTRDLQAVLKRLREATTAAGAVFLDEQIAAVRKDILASYRIDGEVWQDIEASRQIQWTRTTGTPEGKEVRPTGLVRHTQDAAADAALFAVLQRNFQRRQELRRELIQLEYGRQWAAGLDEPRHRLFVQRLGNLSDPEAARQAAVDLYTSELEAMAHADSMGPAPAELATMERIRLERLRTRAQLLREVIPMTREGGANGKPSGSYRILVERAGNATEAEAETAKE